MQYKGCLCINIRSNIPKRISLKMYVNFQWRKTCWCILVLKRGKSSIFFSTFLTVRVPRTVLRVWKLFSRILYLSSILHLIHESLILSIVFHLFREVLHLFHQLLHRIHESFEIRKVRKVWKCLKMSLRVLESLVNSSKSLTHGHALKAF